MWPNFVLGIVSYPHLNDALCLLTRVNWRSLTVALNHKINLNSLAHRIEIGQLSRVGESRPIQNCSSVCAHLEARPITHATHVNP